MVLIGILHVIKVVMTIIIMFFIKYHNANLFAGADRACKWLPFQVSSILEEERSSQCEEGAVTAFQYKKDSNRWRIQCCKVCIFSWHYFTLATISNCKIFAVIGSITTICSYSNFPNSI